MSSTAFLFFWVLGVGYGTVAALPSPFWLCLVVIVLWKLRGFTLVYCLFSLIFGVVYVQTWRISRRPEPVPPGAYRFSGIVVTNPDQREHQTFLTVRLHQPLHPRTHGPPGYILVRARKSASWKYGDELEVIGTVKPPEKFSGFDYPLYLERYGVYGICTPKRALVLSRGNGNPILARLYLLQATLEKQAYALVPTTEAALLNGILLGAKRSLPTDLQEDLRHTGTSHIVVISGANITILIALVIRYLPVYSRRARYICTVLVGAWLTLMTGASASVIRGATVSWISVHLMYNNRKAKPASIFLTLCFLMLLWNPLMLFGDPSFQLSMSAFAGLLFFGSAITKWVNSAPILKKLPEVMRSSLAETLAATSTTFPISFWMFGQISLLGLLVNPLVLWMLPAITLLGSIIIVSPFSRLDSVIGIPLHWLLWAVLSIIEWFGKVPWGIIGK